MKNALIVLADGFEEIEAVEVIDVLRRGGMNVSIAAVGADMSVTSAHSVKIVADVFLKDVIEKDYDAIILPGGQKGTENLKSCEILREILKRQKEENRLICAICAAPTVLFHFDIIEEEDFTCYPGCDEGLPRESANVPVVADGDIITGMAPASALLFALVILQQLTDEETAAKVASGMCFVEW